MLGKSQKISLFCDFFAFKEHCDYIAHFVVSGVGVVASGVKTPVFVCPLVKK
jgi:hypothetical protein